MTGSDTIDRLFNFRDTGGTPLTGGGSTRSEVLYRSAALDALDDAGLAQFSRLPIGVVADFRTPGEQQASPDRLPDSRPIRLVDFPLLEGAIPHPDPNSEISPEAAAEALAQIPSLGDLYVSMLSSGADTFARFARLVAAPGLSGPSAVLVHCTAGKDRTGVAVALSLDAVGADYDAIVADYASSQDHLAGPWTEGMIGNLTAMGIPITDQLVTLLTKTPPEAIVKALAWVRTTYGSSSGYLLSGGLSEDELTALNDRLRA